MYLYAQINKILWNKLGTIIKYYKNILPNLNKQF